VANHPLHIFNIPKQTKHELLASIFILQVLRGKPPVTFSKHSKTKTMETIQTNHELLASIFILKVLRGKPPVTNSKHSKTNHSNHSRTVRIYFYFASIMWQTTRYIF
jgi:hypothetical protein